MISSSHRLKGDIKDVLYKDVYRVRNLFTTKIDHILDIGANIGLFSVMCRMLFPFAKIDAFEPFKETFNFLRQNVALLNIEAHASPLGNGEAFDIEYDWGSCKTANSLKPTGKMMGMYQSKTLAQIAEMCKLTAPYFIKLDCEGAERFIIGDLKSEAVISEAAQVSLEIHYNNGATYLDCPTWKDYDDWVGKFTKHKTFFHCSNKGRGTGIYVMRKI